MNALFAAGIPVKPEVDKLMKLMDEYHEPQTIPHEKIEEIVTTRKTQRAQTIISAWKKRAFKEHNILLVNVRGVGYQLCDPKSRLTFSTKKSQEGKRRIMHASVIAGSTSDKGLSELDKKHRDFIATLPNRLRLMELCQPKNN